MIGLEAVIKSQISLNGGFTTIDKIYYLLENDNDEIKESIETMIDNGEIIEKNRKLKLIRSTKQNNKNISKEDDDSSDYKTYTNSDLGHTHYTKIQEEGGLVKRTGRLNQDYNKYKTISERVEQADQWRKIQDHKNIISIINFSLNPEPYIQMERGDSTLKKWDLPIKIFKAKDILIPIADALEHAHERDIYHLNLKPSNILFKHGTAATSPKPLISDFDCGEVCHPMSDMEYKIDEQHAAPEQISVKEYDICENKIDIYQLGNIAYQCIIGRPVNRPHPAGGIRYSSPPDLNPKFPDALHRSLYPKPSERFESIKEFKQNLIEL